MKQSKRASSDIGTLGATISLNGFPTQKNIKGTPVIRFCISTRKRESVHGVFFIVKLSYTVISVQEICVGT
jgi:hypothetical protein